MIPGYYRFFYLLDACQHALRKYRLRPYEGRITLFKAEQQMPADLFRVDETNGWGRFATGRVDVVDVPGFHNDRLKEPHVREHAQKLLAVLEKAQSVAR